MAATKAIGGIVDNAEKWDPNAEDEPVKEEEEEDDEEGAFVKSEVKSEEGTPKPDDDGMLSFETLDIVSVLKNGKTLLGSSGKEYEYSMSDLDPAERLAAQKKSVTQRLGMGGEYLDDEIVTEKDFASAGSHALPTPRIDTSMGHMSGRPSINSPAIQSSMMSPMDSPVNGQGGEEGLSKRQINALKRKAKANAKNHANKVRVVDLGASRRMSTVDAGAASAAAAPPPATIHAASVPPTPHAIKKEEDGANGEDYFSLDKKDAPDETKIVVEHKGRAPSPSPLIETCSEANDWPFNALCELLMIDLFDLNWTIRHGAAMGLREVVRVHGGGAGRVQGKSRKENNVLNRKWLDDLACRLCCIFMLDRFGDYVSDNASHPPSPLVGLNMLTVSPRS